MSLSFRPFIPRHLYSHGVKGNKHKSLLFYIFLKISLSVHLLSAIFQNRPMNCLQVFSNRDNKSNILYKYQGENIQQIDKGITNLLFEQLTLKLYKIIMLLSVKVKNTPN